MYPFVTRMHQVQVTVQTDQVLDIPCGTRGGVMITFDKVEVVNVLKKDHVLATVRNFGINYDKTWIFDKIHHEINQFCSQHSLQDVYIEKFSTVDDRIREALQEDCTKWDTGIDIVAVRVTKPRIPDVIRRNYEEMEAQKTQLMIAAEKQRVVEKEADTEKRRAKIEAEKMAEVSIIKKRQEIMEQEAARNISHIRDEMHRAREKAFADAEAYRIVQEAEANEQLLTPEFLEYQRYLIVSNRTKTFFGGSVDAMLGPGVASSKQEVRSGGG
mmetsp:Transcript_56872/g.149815  ORF Transcript_56872/g.149815 Transcript_56872/m.149815 type:complete len:271 (+) Transcript_56872:226-1038(+)